MRKIVLLLEDNLTEDGIAERMEYVADLVRDGYTSGYSPNWYFEKEEEGEE